MNTVQGRSLTPPALRGQLVFEQAHPPSAPGPPRGPAGARSSPAAAAASSSTNR
ncbi:hypothetical protein [Streptomyces sp. NPDC051183]|uniref:hypothetical protein n=1 Tax=Streptomyces sp. NPDC051183 TaxID=3155165 RepID=UPI00343D51F5